MTANAQQRPHPRPSALPKEPRLLLPQEVANVSPPNIRRPRALVTGATGGMGREIVRELARTHEVFAIGRDATALAELEKISGVRGLRVDLGDPASIAESIADVLGSEVATATGDAVSARVSPGIVVATGATTNTMPEFDVLVHAAAIGARRSVAEASPADWANSLTVNVAAPAELTRIALPGLRKRAGTIVFIGSGASTRPVPGSAVYTASKHALRGLADALRIEEEPHRVRVVTIAPGQTDTAMLRAGIAPESYAAERYIRPESIALAVRFVVDAPADVHITDLPVRPRQEIARL